MIDYRKALIATFLMVFLISIAPTPGPAAASSIKWHSYDEGFALGKNQGKKLFIHFFAEWCGFCAEMEKKTFQDPAVVASLNTYFIPIKVNFDREKEISAIFRVQGLPDTWFITEKGEIIGHRPGYIPADQLKIILQLIIDNQPGTK